MPRRSHRIFPEGAQVAFSRNGETCFGFIIEEPYISYGPDGNAEWVAWVSDIQADGMEVPTDCLHVLSTNN